MAMSMEPGLSARNPRVQAAARLHRADERRRTGLTLLEGPHLVEEAIAAGVPLAEIFVVEGDSSFAEATLLSQPALERLSSTQTPQSPVAVMPIPDHSLDADRSVLVAWDVSDPGNLGTMIRTAAAFGLDVATIGGADVWSPKTLRGGAGAHFHTSVVEVKDLNEIQAVRVATVLSDGDPPNALPAGRLALLIGSEAHGLPPEAIASAEFRISIPMPGRTESLNAAAAAAILCYEVAKRA
jgi:TrmH family RNA methyltransferase